MWIDQSDFPALNIQSRPSASSRQFNSSTQSRWNQSLRRSRVATSSHPLPYKGKPDIIPNVARGLANGHKTARLTEPNDMILETEDILAELHQQCGEVKNEEVLAEILAVKALELMKSWLSHASPEPNIGEDIGPGANASQLQKATYLSSLLLALRHPPFLESSFDRSRGAVVFNSLPFSAQMMPIPQILIDWLNRYHLSYQEVFDVVKSTTPNCTAHDQFWDITFGMLVRGQTTQVVELLSKADFRHAASALDEGFDEPGYQGTQLQVVQAAIDRAADLLRSAPVAEGEWRGHNLEWSQFHESVTAELESLADSGSNFGDNSGTRTAFQAENFGLLKPDRLLPRTSTSSSAKLPWSIHQNLKILYGILLGGADEIVAQSQDWLEATAALTIWWDGHEDTDITRWSLNVSRAQTTVATQNRDDPYLRRLRASFLCVTDPEYSESFQVNPKSDVEVALACILQGDTEGLLGCIRTLSLLIASAIGEVGSRAGWLNSSSHRNAQALDADDLLVLSYAAPMPKNVADDIMVEYAQQLFDQPEVASDERNSCEGWELAVTVASRIENRNLSATTTTSFLDQLSVSSQTRLEKVLSLCDSLGLDVEARNVSERYADHLCSQTSLYGPALLGYARSRSAFKLRQLVHLLVSCSLVRSAAFPPSDALDDDLRDLVENPRRPLANLSNIDPGAAKMLQFYISGYACLRGFYNVRDEGSYSIRRTGERARKDVDNAAILRNIVLRKRGACKALMAVLNSAADTIYGGLYDAGRESAIPVDGVLTLLGETTSLVASSLRNDERILSARQIYDLLAVIEDVQTISGRVLETAEECLKAALRNLHDPTSTAVPGIDQHESDENRLDKSTISLSLSTMSSKLATSHHSKDMGDSGVLVEASSDTEDCSSSNKGDRISVASQPNARKGGHDNRVHQQVTDPADRGWDWRVNFTKANHDAATTSKDYQNASTEILGFLRCSLARELPMAELAEEAAAIATTGSSQR